MKAELGITAGTVPSIGELAVFLTCAGNSYSSLYGVWKVRVTSTGETIKTAVGGQATLVHVEDVDDGSVGGALCHDAALAQAERAGLPLLSGYVVSVYR